VDQFSFAAVTGNDFLLSSAVLKLQRNWHSIVTAIRLYWRSKWIRQQGVGIPVKRMRDLPRAVGELLEPRNRRAMLRRIKALNNRAVFEVPEVLDRILSERP
jgi:hypothetical protein